jgi:hypothetical protein
LSAAAAAISASGSSSRGPRSNDAGVYGRRSDLRADAAKQQRRGAHASEPGRHRAHADAVNIAGAAIAGVDLVAGHEPGPGSAGDRRRRPGRDHHELGRGELAWCQFREATSGGAKISGKRLPWSRFPGSNRKFRRARSSVEKGDSRGGLAEAARGMAAGQTSPYRRVSASVRGWLRPLRPPKQASWGINPSREPCGTGRSHRDGSPVIPWRRREGLGRPIRNTRSGESQAIALCSHGLNEAVPEVGLHFMREVPIDGK